jgi:CheY-like chemotaxis protein/HPt (histidine-containing phosphotransfer) domain-containing protein
LLFLVVDDDALSRELVTLLLEAEGGEAESAGSGEAAVARIAACASRAKDPPPLPGVVLIDIQMPGLSGNALAAALRAKLRRRVKSAQKTLLLAMSASQPAVSDLTGFDGFLLKPFTVSQLRALVEKALVGKAAVGKAMAGKSRPDESNSGPLPDPLDEDVYAKMSDLMPAAQLGQMYALCIDDARRRIARMRTIAAARDDVEYRKEAHAVKGGSGMIGASELYALAAAAEQDGLTHSGPNAGTTSVTATLERLSLACDRLERILQERTRE